MKKAGPELDFSPPPPPGGSNLPKSLVKRSHIHPKNVPEAGGNIELHAVLIWSKTVGITLWLCPKNLIGGTLFSVYCIWKCLVVREVLVMVLEVLVMVLERRVDPELGVEGL